MFLRDESRQAISGLTAYLTEPEAGQREPAELRRTELLKKVSE